MRTQAADFRSAACFVITRGMRICLALLLTSCALAADLPTTVPARVGSERYVRASWTKDNERIAIRGHIRVLEVEPGGDEKRGLLTIETCWRSVGGERSDLVVPGTKLIIKRAAGKNEFFYEDERPLEQDSSKWLRYVAGLRGGQDDLDFWDGEKVNEARLRRILATADFPIESVRSEHRVEDTDEFARLSVPKLGGKASNLKLKDGNFAVECRWRIHEGQLERFRRTRWVLHDQDDPAAAREFEIVGIESSTPQPWWANTREEVTAQASRLAKGNDPLLGFYCWRAAQDELQSVTLSHTLLFDEDEITGLLKIRAIEGGTN
jgi:hypothetical protein